MKILRTPLFYAVACLLTLIVALWVRGLTPKPTLVKDDVIAITVIEPDGTHVIYSKGQRRNGRVYWYPTKVIPPSAHRKVNK